MTWAQNAELSKKLPDWKKGVGKYKYPLVCFRYRGVALCKTPKTKMTTNREDVSCPYCKKLIREKDFDLLMKRHR